MNGVDILSFDRAMSKIAAASHRHVLLGNGFSIALYPEIFSYGSLYENADLESVPRISALFEALQTQDFEIVIRHLQDAARVVEVYRPNLVKLAASLRQDAAFIKDALVHAIARRHPDRPYDIDGPKYAACRSFLSNFDNVYTLNYDVLLYWALMQDEVDELDMRPDDGFRHPEDDPDQPYVSCYWLRVSPPKAGNDRIENAIARERERRKADWNNLGRRAGQWDGVRTCDILTHLRPSLKIAIVGESVVSYPWQKCRRLIIV